MTLESIEVLFGQYGVWWIIGVCFCEYCNLPGFPAGVILPAIGVLAARNDVSLLMAIAASSAAGLAGSVVLYAICRFGGAPVLDRLFGKSKTYRTLWQRAHSRLVQGGGKALFVCRLIPVLRTIVSLPAGLVGVPLWEYTLYSGAGILVWNSVLIGIGYGTGWVAL